MGPSLLEYTRAGSKAQAASALPILRAVQDSQHDDFTKRVIDAGKKDPRFSLNRQTPYKTHGAGG